MPRLHEQAVRAGVLFAAHRQTLGKERRLALEFGPPERGGRLEQPLPSMRRDGLERARAKHRVRIGHHDGSPAACSSTATAAPRPGSNALARTPSDPREPGSVPAHKDRVADYPTHSSARNRPHALRTLDAEQRSRALSAEVGLATLAWPPALLVRQVNG